MSSDRLDWSGPPLDVVGMGVDGIPTAAAAPLLQAAQLLIGAPRHLRNLTGVSADTAPYPSPLSGLWPLLRHHQGQRIVLLASGDPLLYGIGASLLQRLDPRHLRFHANVSSVQAALARARKPWQHTTVISLHGRPLATLRASLQGNRRYALLTDADSTPADIATLLCACGYRASTLWVAEQLGSSEETITSFGADQVPDRQFAVLNVVVVEVAGAGGVLPEFPGIPDHWFDTDGSRPGTGMISKREVRLAALSLLQPRAGDLGWDVGAGCGGISVEWARWNHRGRVIAIECEAARVEHIASNRERFGVVNNLEIRHDRAPQALADLPAPDAIHVGGSDGDLDAILHTCWQRLKPGGRLVAAAVTEASRAILHEFADPVDAHWTQLGIAHEEYLGSQQVLRPQLPVLLMLRNKP